MLTVKPSTVYDLRSPKTRAYYLLWLLAEEEALVELGFAEAAADDGDGAVVRGAVVLSPGFQQLAFSGHVLREGLETQPGGRGGQS